MTLTADGAHLQHKKAQTVDCLGSTETTHGDIWGGRALSSNTTLMFFSLLPSLSLLPFLSLLSFSSSSAWQTERVPCKRESG